MMSCKEFVGRCTDHVEGRVSFAERARMRLHWLMCAVCRAFLRQMKETAYAAHQARHAPAAPLPPDLEERLLRLHDE